MSPSRPLPAIAAGFVIVLGIALGATVRADEPPAPADLIFTTDDQDSPYYDGCDAISIVDARTRRIVARGEWQQSAGRLAATSDGRLIFSNSNNNFPTLRLMRPMATDPTRWETLFFPYPLLQGGPIAVSPDDATLLVALPGGRVARHALAAITRTSVGPPVAVYDAGDAPGSILFSSDSQTAYVVAVGGGVHVVDVATMQRIGDVIATQPVGLANRARQTYAALSPDGRYVVINTGGATLSVVDVLTRQVTVVGIEGVAQSYGVAFNYARRDEGDLLAVHGHNVVAVYRFRGTTDPELQTTARVVSQQWPGDEVALWVERVGMLAWTGRGDGVVAGIGGQQEFRVFDYVRDPSPELHTRFDFDSCMMPAAAYFGQQLDVLTLNDRVRPPPTASPTQAPSATPSGTATATPSATPSPTVTALSPSPTATQIPTPTATSTPTPVPVPLYLPVVLREHCAPGTQRVDVALVIDASTSMRDGRTSAGRTKLAAAIDAAGAFVGMLALPQDQAAVIAFSSDAQVVQSLTGRRSDIDAALARIPGLVRQQTRIDRGIEEAHAELGSQRHKAQNKPVMIVLTDGLANPVPASVAVDRAKAAKDDGITVFTIGLGQASGLDIAELKQMASRPEYFYPAPDGEDLLGIYRTIAVEIPCPAGANWGRR